MGLVLCYAWKPKNPHHYLRHQCAYVSALSLYLMFSCKLFALLCKRSFCGAYFKITIFHVSWIQATAAFPSHQTSPSHSSRHDLPAGALIGPPLNFVICSCHPASWPANRHVSSYHITTWWKLLILSGLFIPRFVGTRHTLHLQEHSQKKIKLAKWYVACCYKYTSSNATKCHSVLFHWVGVSLTMWSTIWLINWITNGKCGCFSLYFL